MSKDDNYKLAIIRGLQQDIKRNDIIIEGARALGVLAVGGMSEREFRLRAGHREVSVMGGRVVHFYWEPYFDEGVAKQGFCIEIDSWMDRIRIENFEEALSRFENLEREIIIQTMVKELIGPQDTVKVRKPPK